MSLWKNAEAVRESWAEPEALIEAFDRQDDAHVASWFALDAEERQVLLRHPHRRAKWPRTVAESLAYKAYEWISGKEKRVEEAYALFDDLIELPVETFANCWVNALWAVLPDNSGLPLDEARCRRYLEHCLPHASQMQGLWWNAACVYQLLGDVDACLDALEKHGAKGEDLEGPCNDKAFRDLWDHPRFRALFADVDPPTVHGMDEVGDDPLTVRKLDLDDIGGEPPKAILEMKNLEVLELNGEALVVPEWLAELPKLRKLHLWSYPVKRIDDAVLAMPSLEEFECWSELPKGYDAKAINQLLKSFRKNDVAAEARPVHIGLLVGRKMKGVPDEAIVEALGSTATKLHRAALRELETRWGDRRLEPVEGGNVAIVGRLAGDRSALSERLERLGMDLKRKPTKKTVAIVIGPRHGGKALPYVGGEVPVLLEAQLHASLDAHDVRHLEGAPEEGVADQLSELLLSTDGANVALALEMIKRGGLPDGLLEALLLAWQTKDLDKKTRNGAKTLFERYASKAAVDSVKKHLKRTNIFASGETKLASRLKAITKESKGELDGMKLARAMLERGGSGLKYMLKETKDSAERKALLAHRQKGDTLHLSGLELTRIPDEVAELEGVRILEAQGNRINRLTDSLLSLSGLEKLNLCWNALTEIPDEIDQLTSLRSLDLSSNLFTRFPEALARLTWLEELDFSSETYSPKMKMKSLPESLGAMKGLRTLIIGAHRLETLPESLKALPALETLSLGSGRIGQLPAWLVDLPALKTLEAQYLEVKDAEGAEAIFVALVEKGVTVER